MRFRDETWVRFRALPGAWQALLWLLLFWVLLPLLIWRSSLSRGWKTGLSVVFAIALIAIGTSGPQPATTTTTAPRIATESADADDEDDEAVSTDTASEDDDISSVDAGRSSEADSDNDEQERAIRGPIVTVTRVIDGDTIEVNLRGGTVDVRLIGVDTPETVHPSEPVECFGPEASKFTSSRLSGDRVRLEFDVERTDRYGRTLAYVWLGDKLFNRVLVRQGFAQVSTYPPNVKYVEKFTAAQRAARESDAGLWGATCPSEEEQTAKQRAPVSGGGKSCDPNYTGACIPPYPPDLDCTEISATNFKSVGSDPHGFDGNGDGIACES